MKFSESWLRELANPDLSCDELIAQLTMAGLEVDGVEAAANFRGVVVARIESVAAHPKADKLQVCQVNCGSDAHVQVVCGAPNARAGLVTAFAQVGATLPGGLNIGQAKLRDVDSFGMLCGGDELGLNEDTSGIMALPDDAPLGQTLNAFYALDDQIIEVDLTPNRGDCLSIQGLAREVGVLNKITPQLLSTPAVAATTDKSLSITISAPSACSHYAGRVISAVDMSQPSPQWMQEKLRRSGIRSIDAVVDVGNYVMLELGQPMHAFDLDTLSGAIDVRFAEEGEQLVLLDGAEVDLKAQTLLIADNKGPLAIAGIMGGKSSGVSASTQSIFLESAHFLPLALAGKAREYGLHTDASHRFERGVDTQLPLAALERATELLLEIVGGQAGPVTSAGNAPEAGSEPTITLRKSRLQQQLALDIADDLVVDMLTRLGLGVSQPTVGEWLCTVPSWRFDLAIEADLIEELARIYGYNNLPVTTINMPLEIQPTAEATARLADIRQLLVSRDYQEAITYSFVDPALQSQVNPGVASVDVANPISADMAVMRTSLLTGLLSTVKYNLNRQQSRVRVFESGLRFLKEGGQLSQQKMLAGAITGTRAQEAWAEAASEVDFYDIKGDVEAVLAYCGTAAQVEFAGAEHPALHPGQTLALINTQGQTFGHVGRVHPSLQQSLGLSQAVYVFELVLADIIEGEIVSFDEISKFPAVRRDISLSLQRDVLIGELVATARASAGDDLVDLKVFDVYEGKHLETNRKSVAIGLTFQDKSRTLNDEDVNAAMDAVIKALESNHDANLRG
ncbi:MAG: phenylalanine--tRNA ligase subunit beta [Gammaproteobacteria bacterium]|nr:phenylalanine--tRNA ligase subunit beta [Gammaproteobacteria bacterium]MBQ0840288.1 phenylalanine--tRNA ligase subunit beta [Gammaproteobacteria bacterium]